MKNCPVTLLSLPPGVDWANKDALELFLAVRDTVKLAGSCSKEVSVQPPDMPDVADAETQAIIQTATAATQAVVATATTAVQAAADGAPPPPAAASGEAGAVAPILDLSQISVIATSAQSLPEPVEERVVSLGDDSYREEDKTQEDSPVASPEQSGVPSATSSPLIPPQAELGAAAVAEKASGLSSLSLASAPETLDLSLKIKRQKDRFSCQQSMLRLVSRAAEGAQLTPPSQLVPPPGACLSADDSAIIHQVLGSSATSSSESSLSSTEIRMVREYIDPDWFYEEMEEDPRHCLLHSVYWGNRSQFRQTRTEGDQIWLREQCHCCGLHFTLELTSLTILVLPAWDGLFSGLQKSMAKLHEGCKNDKCRKLGTLHTICSGGVLSLFDKLDLLR